MGATAIVQDLDLLMADAAVRRASAARDQCAHILTVAIAMAKTRAAQAWRPKIEAALRAKRDALDGALAVTRHAEALEAERAQALGFTPRPVAGPSSQQLAAGVEAIARTLNPPTVTPPPPPLGTTRVLVREPFYDRERIKRYPGLEDLDDADAKEALEKGWAVPG